MSLCTTREIVAAALLAMVLGGAAHADWPMPGHDPQRSSWAPEDQVAARLKPLWCRKIGPYIPNKVQIITVAAGPNWPALVLVSTARGLYALDPLNGEELWYYRTEMPIDHSPTVVDGVVYFGCTDKTVHAVEAATGRRIWRTLRAGAAFDTNPVVVEGRVLIGNRDGYFYAFDAKSGKLLWYYRASGPISFSAAYDSGTVYFADKHNYVYALRAADGKLLWRSPQLPGAGFISWWPVVNGDRLLVPGTNNFGKGQGGPPLFRLDQAEVFPPGTRHLELIGPVDSEGWIDAERIARYLREHPHRQTLHVLDRATGKPVEVAPVLWWGNSSGNRYPPVVGPEGLVYTSAIWAYGRDYLKGRIAAWKMGTAKLKPFVGPRMALESCDEFDAYAMIGERIIAYNRGGGGDDGGGLFVQGRGSLTTWDFCTLQRAFPGYAKGWEDWKYGNAPPKGYGTHGYQNPPVPLDGRIYFHRSNSVICYGPTDTATGPPDSSDSPPRRSAQQSRTEKPQPTATEPADVGKLPTVRSAEELLAEEIRKMLQAGHLRPVLATPTEHYFQAMRDLRGANMHVYWHNPADTIYTLLRALQHVPPTLRNPLKEYIQREWEEYPPFRYTHMGWKGAPREIFPIPPPMRDFYAGRGRRPAPQKPSRRVGGRWKAWSFNPFNIYACWAYAKEFGGAEVILERLRSRIGPPPPPEVVGDMAHVLNCYVAGYIGYIGLERLAGRRPSQNVVQWLEIARRQRVELLAMDPRELPTTEAGGFLYLVPEFGDYLHDHARELVARHVTAYNELAPLWFLSEADEPSRVITRTRFAEGATAHFYDYVSLFNAKAFALKEPREELERYLDVPGVWRGDLFYIQNLVSTIEAGTRRPER